MIEPIPAAYRTLRMPKYRGNPLIEALPAPCKARELQKRLTQLPELPTDLHQLSPMERKIWSEDLAYAFLTPPQAQQFYEEVYITLQEGYVARNPLNIDVARALYQIRDPFGAPHVGSKTASTSLLLVGPTGFGKSTIIRHVFSLIPPVIQHTGYKGSPFNLKQLVYLKIDCPSNGSGQAFINNLWQAFDTALGGHSKYYEQYVKARLRIPDQQKAIAQACATHGVGFLVVDEVHYLRQVLDDGDKEKATLPFVDELLNGVGIPVLLIGTWKSARLLNRNATTTRRVCSGTTFTQLPYTATDRYWKLLVSTLWEYQVCLKPIPLNARLEDVIYHCTQGLPALLVKLLRSAQKMAIDTQKEKVDEAVLMHVYRTDFIFLHDALNALRRGDTERYEDLLPRRRLDD